MIGDFLDFLFNGLFDFLTPFFDLLPAMPELIDFDSFGSVQLLLSVLRWVNYFLPFDVAATIIAAWTVAMFAYIVTKLTLTYGRKVMS